MKTHIPVLALILVFSTCISLFTFAGNDGYFCDPNTGVCYPSKDTNSIKDPDKSTQPDSQLPCLTNNWLGDLLLCPYRSTTTDFLKLNDQQIKNLDSLIKTYNEKDEELTAKEGEIESKLKKILTSSSPDFTQAEQLIKKQHSIRLEKDLDRLNFYKQFFLTLSGDQKTRLSNKLDKESAKDIYCPVTGDKIDNLKSVPNYEYEGKIYYFCSINCYELFKKNPEKYLE